MFQALTCAFLALAIHAPGIHGRVRGFDGEPVPDVILNIVDADGQYLADTYTRADGSFRFRENAAAKRVFVWLEGVELEHSVSGEADVLFDFQHAPRFTLDVRALDPEGAPLPDVEMFTVGANDVCMARPKTDRDGRFHVRCNHRVERFVVAPGGWRHVVKGPFEADAEITIDLRDQGFFKLSGLVTDENAQPVAGAVIAATDGEYAGVAHTNSDAAGRYGLWANRKIATLYVNAGEFVRCMSSGAWERTQTIDLDWRKLGLVVLTGRVLDASGKPVPNVALVPSSSEDLAGHPEDPVGRSAKDGTFRVLVPARTGFLIAWTEHADFLAAGPWPRDAAIELRPKR